MTGILAWVFALTTIVLLLRIVARDSRLWGKRIDGSPRWRIWIRPKRIGEGMRMDIVERERRASPRDVALAIGSGILAFVLSIL